ncbi:2548_t:CDS:1, partial [Dentiscutata heterogama]
MIGNKEKQILNSILERTWKKIKIDKIAKRDPENNSLVDLIYEPEKIKEEVKRYFSEQYKPKPSNRKDLTPE